jgi:hypothetical protein
LDLLEQKYALLIQLQVPSMATEASIGRQDCKEVFQPLVTGITDHSRADAFGTA